MSKKQQPRAERHVRLFHWMMKSPAWRTLPPAGRALYIEMAFRYNGSNNGKIGYSVREAAHDLNIAKDTAGKMFQELEERGFIETARRSAFSCKARYSREWRLTEFECHVTKASPSKKFMTWGLPTVAVRVPETRERELRRTGTG